jgi:hypothetical protein
MHLVENLWYRYDSPVYEKHREEHGP